MSLITELIIRVIIIVSLIDGIVFYLINKQFWGNISTFCYWYYCSDNNIITY
jgi:hypothetical protein